MNRPPIDEEIKTADASMLVTARPGRAERARWIGRTWLFAAALVAGGAALTSSGCSGSTEQTLTPAGDGEAVEVDVDRDPNTGGVGVDVDVDGARNEPGRDPIEINVRGSDDAQTAPERRQERRERIGEALDNLNVDVNTDDVQVDVD